MKRLLVILTMVVALLAANTTEIQAQKGRAVKKLIEAVTKKGKKAPVPKKPVKNRQSTYRPRVHTETCSLCKGEGVVLQWDPYMQQYCRARCYKCNGTGRVRYN